MKSRVLIVDDEQDICDALKRVYERENMFVQTAVTGSRALELLALEPVDLIVTDIVMPGMDGVNLIREVKADYPKTKIIAISGGGEHDPSDYKPDAVTTSAFLAAAQSAGADAIITKPFGRDDIIKVSTEVGVAN